MTFTSQLFDSFAEVPAAWQELCGRDDLAMDARALAVFQRTLADQCRCWGLLVAQDGRPVAAAALCSFPTEIIETNNGKVNGALKKARKFWPGFMQLRVLFCGLPVPSGSTHLRMADGVDAQAVIGEVQRVMRELAKQSKSRLMVFKEMNDASPFAAILSGAGYLRGDIPPMHHLDKSFPDFSAYAAALKNRYRAQILRSQKKLQAAGFEIVCGRGHDFFKQHFSDNAHALYVNVHGRAEHKLELMTDAFFRQLAKELDKEVLLTAICKDGKLCAFTFSITRGNVHYNLYSGLDYALNNEGDLYFNLFYTDMDQAFRCGATSLHFGQTSDSFKSRLGTHTEKLYFFAHAVSPAFHRILKIFAPMAFPKVAEVAPNDVFGEAPPPRKSGPKKAKSLVTAEERAA